MQVSAASRDRRKSASILFRSVPVVAALMMLSPGLAVAQGSSTPETPAASAGADAAAGAVSSYTDEQASRGKSAYNDNCSGCHGTTLGGSGEAPALAGKGFRERWFIGSPEPFFTYISTNMPQGDPGSLEPETYADIAAYLMSRNHVPAGDTELPSDAEALTKITLPPLN